MKNIYALFFTGILLANITSCNNSTDISNDVVAVQEEDNFYELYYNTNIKPAINHFIIALKKERDLINAFEREMTATHLTTIQNQWLECAKAYMKVRAYNFGLIKDRFYDTNLFNYPANATAIENNINQEVIFNTAYFQSKSTVTKGLSALEYLLYHENDGQRALELLIQDSYRFQYTKGITKELISVAENLLNLWEEEYKNKFINANGSLCSVNNRCLSFNQLINVIDILKVSKIGKPAGFEKSDNVAPETLEAYRSKKTLEITKASLQEIQYAYMLSNVNFAKQVDKIKGDDEISKAIENAFKRVFIEIDKLELPLHDQIKADKEKVKPIYDALKELTILFSVDAASILSVTILPTDNDGD